jgi:acyl carrier protein
MSKKAEIKEFIIDKIEEKSKLLDISFEPEAMKDDFSLTGTGIFDSMDFMNLITDIEEKFNVEVDFSNHEPESFTTLTGFIECISYE